MTTDADAAIKYAPTPDGLEDFSIPDPYADWLKAEGVKVIVDYAFDDIANVELGPWERKGGKGAVINIPYHVLTNDTHVVEINPSGSSEPEHHVYEEYVYIVSGRGATSIWPQGSEEKKTFEWKKGSLFSIPLNCWYQHFNGSGAEPARYLAVTTAPANMRLFSDNDFIFQCEYPFSSRYSSEDDFFSGNGKLYTRRIWASNFMPNAPDMALYAWNERGAGGINSMFEMAGNLSKAHISEFPVGTYKKAHRHGPRREPRAPQRRRRILAPVDEGRHVRYPEGGLEGRLARHRAERRHVPPALQFRHEAGALHGAHAGHPRPAGGHSPRPGR